MRSMTLGMLGTGLGLGLLACSNSGVFTCTSDDQCTQQGQAGVCQPVGYCSFPDGACPSGHRYGTAAGDSLAGQCVDPEPGSTGVVPTSGPMTDETTTDPPGDTTLALDASTGPVVVTTSGSDSTSGESTGPVESCATQPDADTLSLYPLDSRLTVVDVVGGHDGQWREGAPVLVEGPPGCGLAARFDGMLDAVVPDHEDFHLTEGSVDLWVRLPPPPPFTASGLVSRDASGNVFGGHFSVWYAADGRLAVRQQPPDPATASHIVCSNEALPEDTWLHVGVNFGAPGLELYIDGVPQQGDGTVVILDAPRGCRGDIEQSTYGIDGNDNPWVLGASAGGSEEGGPDPVGDWFTGALDELRISSIRREFSIEP